jgi:hypothetical protein
VNWRHLLAVVWLRWRILNNQWRRAGSANLIISLVVALVVAASAVPLFIASLVVGLYAIPRVTPLQLMYAWDGLVVGFLFFWTIGLINELQRSEPLALAKFQHLPVSLNSAFLINYLSSLFRLSLILFGPVMLGFALALVIAKGPRLFPVLPALAAFFLMVSAPTYQLQGWLAGLMDNPRLRRTIVVGMTAVIIGLSQLPNLLNLFHTRGRNQPSAASARLARETAQLDQAFRARQLTADEYARHLKALKERFERDRAEARRATSERWERIAQTLNRVLPVGWLPLGVLAAAEGRVAPALLGLLGMALIGSASLAMAYRTTVRQYQGTATSRPRRAAAATDARDSSGRTRLLEVRLPLLSEPVSAIALGGFRSLLRAPEAKMMLLSPLIMIPIFAAAFLNKGADPHALVRPITPIAGGILIFIGLLQLMGNQFGFDRDGFRVFVLSSARRRDILLGKNLAFAPVALGMDLILLVIVQVAHPLRLDHLLAMLPQYLSMFLMFCTTTNVLSIYTPLYVSAGALRASSVKLSTVLLQMAIFAVVFPLTMGLTCIPLLVEGLLDALGWIRGLPVCLVLSVLELGVIVLLYNLALRGLGQVLQAREQRILETVTSRAT